MGIDAAGMGLALPGMRAHPTGAPSSTRFERAPDAGPTTAQSPAAADAAAPPTAARPGATWTSTAAPLPQAGWSVRHAVVGDLRHQSLTGSTAGVAPGPASAPPSDQQLGSRLDQRLRMSASGRMLAERLAAVGALVRIVGDGDPAARGRGAEGVWSDEAGSTLFVRRSRLLAAPDLAAIELAHEGTHLLDAQARVADPYIAQAAAGIARLGEAAGAEAVGQVQFELLMARETRATTFAGQVAAELGIALQPGDPTQIAAAGGNSPATYAAVWNALLASPLNVEGRSAPVRIV